jgi:hypothetical protein
MKPESKNPSPGDDEIEDPLAVPAPAPTDKPAAGDARDDAEKLKQNREHLDVNEEHKTPDMEEGHRGTFP